MGVQHGRSRHLPWQASLSALKGTFSPDWICGEHSFIFLAVFQEGLEISVGAIVSHFFFFLTSAKISQCEDLKYEGIDYFIFFS